MESYVAEPTLRNKLPNWQPGTSSTHRPPSAKKAKNDLANKRTREQVTQRRTTTFCININSLADPMTYEYYITKLWQDEELAKLKK
jgi:hypothetical protein